LSNNSVNIIIRLIKEAYEALFEAWEALRRGENQKAVRMSIKTIEKSVNAVKITLREVLGASENLMESADTIIKAMEGIKSLEKRRLARVHLIEALWLNPKVIQICEQGMYDLKPKNILKELEARAAVEHASEVYYWADSVTFKLVRKKT